MKFVVISALLFFSYYAYSAEPSDSTPLAEKIYKDISDIINDEKLTLTSKIDKLETSLTAAKSYISANQFAILFAKAEPILILDADNPTTTVYQIIFLISQFQNSEIWVFSEPRERVTTRIISLKENALKNAAISEVDASVKNQLEGAVNMFLANELSSQGRFEEADKSFDELFKSIEGSGSLYPQIKYVCSQIKLKSLLARGDLKGALDLSNQLDDQFDSMVDFIRQSKHPRFNNEDISMLSASFQVDMFLGKYDEVIRKGSWLLSLMPREDGNLKLMKNKAELLKNLALAYEKKGNEELATDFNKQAEILDAKTDYVDFPVLFKKFFNAMHDKNYEYAKNVIEKIKVFFSKAYPFANEIEKSIFEKITMEQSRYVQSEMIEFKKPLKECKSIDCLNVNQKISELREEIDRTNDETAKVFLAKYLVLLDKFVDIEIKKNDLNRMGMHMTKIAPFLEEIYFLGIQDGTLRVSDQLDLLISLHDYYVISDKQYAAYFARTYINKLQKIRGQLKLINDQDLQYFTEAQSDTLKKFSKTFFDIGEPESALLCLKIIKQNEFYDFVKRGTLSEGYFISMPTTKYENDYNLKFERITNEIKNLKLSQLKNIPQGESNLIGQAILQKQKEIISMRNNFKIESSKYSDKKIASTPKPNAFKVNSDEAIIQIFLTEQSVQSYLITTEGVKYFNSEFSREEINKLILEFNLTLSKRLPISRDKIADLSDALISKPLNALTIKNIKKIRVMADSYLNLIPISLLVFNEKEIGEKFIIEHIGLGENKSVNKADGDSFDVFGASQGNEEFSKLPGVLIEVDALMTLPTKKSIVKRSSYVDDDFTNKSLIESFKKGTSFVHIATHFQAKGNVAGSSKLLLGDGSVISLEELRSRMPYLKSKLITLSACETSDLIPSNKGKAFEGLSNVFQVNGAKNVISTSWDVSDDATSTFMGIFYSILLNNDLSASEALFFTQNIFRLGSISALPKNVVFKQSSKQRLLDHLAQYAHPYYWAAFRISTLN